MQILQRFSVTLSLVIIAWLFCKLLVYDYKVTKNKRDYQLLKGLSKPELA